MIALSQMHWYKISVRPFSLIGYSELKRPYSLQFLSVARRVIQSRLLGLFHEFLFDEIITGLDGVVTAMQPDVFQLGTDLEPG